VRTHWIDRKHWSHNMISEAFIVLRRLGAGKHALNSLMLKMVFCMSVSPCCYREGLSLICRGGLGVCWSLLLHLLRKWTLKDFCISSSLTKTLKESLPSLILQACRRCTDICLIQCTATSRSLWISIVHVS